MFVNVKKWGTYNIFNFAALNLLRLGRVTQLPLPCCDSEWCSYFSLAVNSDSDIIPSINKGCLHTLQMEWGPLIEGSFSSKDNYTLR
jgi:hypothetical protein